MSSDKLPKEVDGLQLNFCKTLACDNFGLSADNRYVFQHVNPKRPAMVCRECGAFPPLLNNREVLNEFKRLRTLHNDGLPACKNIACQNFSQTVLNYKHLYHAFGYSGDRQRYRCKSCQTTFVDKWSGQNGKLEFQEQLLGYLFTGHSVRDICRKLQMNPKTFYDHVNQIACRCRRKLAMFDNRWMNHADEYHLSSHYSALQPCSQNGVFWMVTSDARTGYVLAQHTNYSFNEEPTGSIVHNPYKLPARFVSKKYQPEFFETIKRPASSLRENIHNKYHEILARGNVEDPMGNLPEFNYPSKGAIIRPPYTSYAHYLHVFSMCKNDKRVSIFIPQDPVLRSAALSVCLPRIQRHNIDLMYVEEFEKKQKPELTQKIDIVHMGWWRDRWAIRHNDNHSKGVCYLAGNHANPEHWLNVATTGQTQYYQQRFQDLFHGFINEPRRKLRPSGLLPLIDIFRAWHNLCYQNKHGMTPAQLLELTDKPLTLRTLLS